MYCYPSRGNNQQEIRELGGKKTKREQEEEKIPL